MKSPPGLSPSTTDAPGGEQRRMDGRGGVRPHCGNEVDLDRDLHAGLHPVEAAERSQGGGERRTGLNHVIAPAGDDGNIKRHQYPSNSSEI